MARTPKSSQQTLAPAAQRLLQEAVALHRTGRTAEAAELYRKLLREPALPLQALNLAAVAFSRIGDLKLAERALTKALKKDPADPEALGNLARLSEQAGNHRRARDIFRRALKVRPDDADLHYGLGCAEAAMANMKAAEAAFENALALAPDHLRAINNLGNALAVQGRAAEAKEVYRRALDLDPGYAEAWFNLGNAEQALEEPIKAENAYRTALLHDPAHLSSLANLGSVLFDMGRFDEAASVFRKTLDASPEFSEGWNNLGNTLERLGQYDEAVVALERSIAIRPGYSEAIGNLGIVYDRLDEPEKAAACYEKALSLSPDSSTAYAYLANLFEKRNLMHETREVLAKGLKQFADDPELALVAAKCDRREGKLDEALARLLAIRDQPVRRHIGTQIEMELGRCFDRSGDAVKAYESFAAGNRLAAQALKYSNVDKTYFQTKVENLTQFAARAEFATAFENAPGVSTGGPIFLVGFPRSGTTLLDVTLDGHPGVKTMEEKPAVAVMEAEFPGPPGTYGPALLKMPADGIARLKTLYEAEVARSVTLSPGQRLVDKFPLNIIQIPLILKIFPDAQFILAVRHPCDVILSCFMQAFEPNPAMANFFGLEDAAKLYDKVMGLWLMYEEALPISLHRLRYEDLVADPENTARSLIRFLGLKWHDEVLHHVETSARRGRINTPSYYQVSEPIYKRASGRWRRYEGYLEPHLELLMPYIKAFGYA